MPPMIDASRQDGVMLCKQNGRWEGVPMRGRRQVDLEWKGRSDCAPKPDYHTPPREKDVRYQFLLLY